MQPIVILAFANTIANDLFMQATPTTGQSSSGLTAPTGTNPIQALIDLIVQYKDPLLLALVAITALFIILGGFHFKLAEIGNGLAGRAIGALVFIAVFFFLKSTLKV